MITADFLAMQPEIESDPVAYTRDMFSKFAEILRIVEEEKANFEGESLVYFQMFAEKLISKYLDEAFCESDEGYDDPILDERKANLANEKDQMYKHAGLLRSLMMG